MEVRMVAHGRGGQPLVKLLDELLLDYGVEVVPPGAAEIEAAHAAFIAYGRGSGHLAKLNFGDLFGYALTKGSWAAINVQGQRFQPNGY